MDIILHIGVEKTGTSSIQRFLRLNREMLKRNGILYSAEAGGENHMALAAAAEADEKYDDLRIMRGLNTPAKLRDFRARLSQALAAEAAASGCSTIVFSGEHCSSRLTAAAELDRLAAILGGIGGDIRVIVYLRRQDEFLCSSYSTDVKSGHSGAMRLPPPQLRENRYNFEALLDRWCSVFGREQVICKRYDLSRFRDGDVVNDFAETIGIDPDGYERPKRVNESLDVTTLEFLRLFNLTVPRFRNEKPNKLRGNLIQVLQRFSDGPTPTLPKEQMTEFMEYFRASNANVARKYFEGVAEEGDPLFGRAQSGADRAEMRPIDADTAVALAGRLWEHQQQRLLQQARQFEKQLGAHA